MQPGLSICITSLLCVRTISTQSTYRSLWEDFTSSECFHTGVSVGENVQQVITMRMRWSEDAQSLDQVVSVKIDYLGIASPTGEYLNCRIHAPTLLRSDHYLEMIICRRVSAWKQVTTAKSFLAVHCNVSS